MAIINGNRFVALIVSIVLFGTVEAPGHESLVRETPFQLRPYLPAATDNWKAEGICYGPYRDGQRPGGEVPSKSELREDLQVIAKHWSVLRMYGAIECTPTVCEIIREDELPLKLVVGAWIQSELRRSDGINKNSPGELVDSPEAAARNVRHVQTAIQLAKEYPDVVAAICIGNEALVSWSGHAIQPDQIVQYIRQSRSETQVPVTVADDFLFWSDPKSKPVADELDFLITHIYAMWNGKQLDDAIAFTQEKYNLVKQRHPDKLIVIGEAGWATAKPASGDRAARTPGVAGEQEQLIFHEGFCEWTRTERIPTFYFAAFDQNWKGPSDPLDVEKHWGLFRADRTAKLAIAGQTEDDISSEMEAGSSHRN